jgi:integrase
VPIPPRLVELLRSWIEELGLGDDDLLFRTRNDLRPAPSNWSRAIHRAYRTVGPPPLRVYDCRHAAATTWLGAGVPWGEVARRLGHSVETLVSTYVGRSRATTRRRLRIEFPTDPMMWVSHGTI